MGPGRLAAADPSPSNASPLRTDHFLMLEMEAASKQPVDVALVDDVGRGSRSGDIRASRHSVSVGSCSLTTGSPGGCATPGVDHGLPMAAQRLEQSTGLDIATGVNCDRARKWAPRAWGEALRRIVKGGGRYKIGAGGTTRLPTVHDARCRERHGQRASSAVDMLR